jgi:hypothetical protein
MSGAIESVGVVLISVMRCRRNLSFVNLAASTRAHEFDERTLGASAS